MIDIGQHLTDEMAEMESLMQKVNTSSAKESKATQMSAKFSQFRAGELTEGALSPTDIALGIDPDSGYATFNPSKDPNDHPLFSEERANQRQQKADSLAKKLNSALTDQILPAKGSDGWTTLISDATQLRKINEEAKKQGKSFGDIWLEDVDLSKMTYAAQTGLNMQARMYELMLQGQEPDLAASAVAEEFSESFGAMQADPEYAALLDMTPEQRLANFKKAVEADKMWQDTRLIGTVNEMERASGQIIAGLAIDLPLSMAPGLGTAHGAYIGVTGDDYIINAMTDGPDEKLPWWARALNLLPVISPLFKAGKKLTKLVQAAQTEGLGPAVSSRVMRGGSQTLKEAMLRLREIGNPKYEELMMAVREGVGDVDETTLLTVLRSIEDTNRGASLARLNAKVIPQESPVVQLAKIAIESGDTNARRKIAEMILTDAGPQRTKAIQEALGLESGQMETLLYDTRNVGKASTARATLIAAREDAVKQRLVLERRLENLKKARETRAANVAARKAETEAATEAAEQAEEAAKEAPSFEATSRTDVKPTEDPKVGQTMPTSDGGDAKVVAIEPEGAVVAKPDGSIEVIASSLSDGQRDFIAKKVAELGSVEKVVAHYGTDGKVAEYARLLASDMFNTPLPATKVTVVPPTNAPETAAQKIGKTLRLKKARQAKDQLHSALLDGDQTAVEDLKKLLTRLEADQALNNATDAAAPSRGALISEVRKVLKDAGQAGPTAAVKQEPSEAAKAALRAIEQEGTAVTAKSKSIPDVAAPESKTVIKKSKGGYQFVRAGKDPMVLFHGTDAAFDEFDLTRGDLGVHFGTAEQATARTFDVNGIIKPGANLRPASLAFKKLIELPDITFRDPDEIMKALREAKALPYETQQKLEKFLDSLGHSSGSNTGVDIQRTKRKLNVLRETLLREGIDGIQYENKFEGAGTSYISLDPKRNVVPVFRETKKVKPIKVIKSKDFDEALTSGEYTAKEWIHWFDNNAPSAVDEAVVKRIRDLVPEDLKINLVEAGDTKLPKTTRGRYTFNIKTGDPVGIFIKDKSFGKYKGTPEVLLHELVHAASARKIELAARGKVKGTELEVAYKRLENLRKRISTDVNNVLNDYVIANSRQKLVGQELEGADQAAKFKYASGDVHEFVAHAMTHKDFQEYLKTIEVDGVDGWTKFVETILELLGLPPTDRSALAEIMKATDNLLSADIRFKG